MSRRRVTILYGAGYTTSLDLNGQPGGSDKVSTWAYHTRVHELFDGVEQEAKVSQFVYTTPHHIRAKVKDRAFTISCTVNGINDLFDPTFFQRVDDLKRAVYNVYNGQSNPVLILVERGGRVMYIKAALVHLAEKGNGAFDIHMLAADGIMTEYTGTAVTYGAGVESVTIGNGGSGYGTTPPTVTISGGGGSGAAGVAKLTAGVVSGVTMTAHGINYTSVPTATFSAPPSGITATGTAVMNSMTPAYTTGSGGVAAPLPIPYVGTAATEPVITFAVQNTGFIWRYHKDFTITNKSPVTLLLHPVCLDLGNIQPEVTAGRIFLAADNLTPKDLRVETFGGARKQIFVRPTRVDVNTLNCKVWFTVYQLAPGETKSLRVLYGNSLAVAESENAATKPMLNMNSSDNAVWNYNDFAPRFDQPQSRAAQWTPHTPSRRNLFYIDFPMSAEFFTPPSSNTLVPCAGGRVPINGQSAGYAGLQLNTSIAIQTVAHDYRKSTNFRAPFVLRSQRQDGSWIDDFIDAEDTGYRVGTTTASAGNIVRVDPLYGPILTLWAAALGGGNTAIRLYYNNNTFVNSTVNFISPGGFYININDTIVNGPAIIKAVMYKNYGPRSQVYPSGQEPRIVMFGLRVDRPDLSLAETVYAGVDLASIYFLSAEQLVVGWSNLNGTRNSDGSFNQISFANGQRFDLNTSNAAHGYQLNGRIYNQLTGIGLPINTILRFLNDKFIVDCIKRTAMYIYYLPDPTLVSPTSLTANGAVGTINLTVNSATGYAIGDQFYVALNNLEYHFTTITGIASNVITIKNQLPSAAASGNLVGKWESRIEALDLIKDGIRPYWIRLEPGQNVNTIAFDPSAGTNNLSVSIWYPARYY